jgi:hypothetical protein
MDAYDTFGPAADTGAMKAIITAGRGHTSTG